MNLKIFGKNAVIYAIGTTSLRASGFLLIPIYTHFLSLSDYGLLSTLFITINFMVTVIDLGLRSGLMRYFVEFSERNRLKELLGSYIILNIITGIIASLIVMLFLRPVFVSVLHTQDVTQYMVIVCVASVIQSLSVNLTSYYRTLNQGMKYMIRNIAVAALIILISIVFFLLFDSGVGGALIAYIISYGSVGLIIAFSMIRETGFGISKEALYKLFRYSAPLILATSGFSIMETTSTYFLSFFTSLEQVGIYNLGYRLAGIAAMIIILPFQLAYEPFVFANLNKPNIKEIISKVTTYLVLAFTVIAFLVVFFSRPIIPLISPPEYYSAYYIIFLFLPGIGFHGLFYIGQSLLHIKDKTHITGIAVAVFSVLSVVLNYFMIKQFGLNGLLIVYNFIWAFIALLLMTLGLRTFSIQLEKKRLAVVSGMFVFLIAFVYLMQNTPGIIFYTVVPAAFISLLLLLYFGGFVDEKEKELLGKVFNSIKFNKLNVFSRRREELI